MARPASQASPGRDTPADDKDQAPGQKPRTVPLPARAAVVVVGALVLRAAWRWWRGPRPGHRRLGPRQPLTSRPGEVSVLTCNIMTHSPDRRGAGPSGPQTSWQERWAPIAAMLDRADADVVCLQEVDMQQ